MATAEALPRTDLKCSRCEGELDTEGYPKWCKKCKAKWQREYQSLKKEMGERHGYTSGCRDARAALADHFLRFPNSMFSGTEVWAMINKAPIGGPE